MTPLLALVLATAHAAVPAPEAVTAEAVAEMPTGPDRSSPPAVLPAVPLDLPPMQVIELSPGVVLHLVPAPTRKVEFRLTLHKGRVDFSEHSAATFDALGTLWDVATTDHAASDLEVLQDLTNVYVASYSGNHAVTFEVEAPRHQLDQAVDLLGSVLHRPTFPGRELRRYKREEATDLLDLAPTDAGRVAQAALKWAWFPADHPYGERPDLDALQGIRRADLLDLAQTVRATSAVELLMVGDLTAEEATAAARTLLDGVGADAPRSQRASLGDHAGLQVFGVDMPEQTQTTLAVRADAPARLDDDRRPFQAVQFALGGTFLSRLNANLREDKGFTYGIYSRYGASLGYGTWSAFVEVLPENTAAAIREIRHEIDRVVADGLTPDELDAHVRDQVASWNDTFTSASSAANLYDALLWTGDTLATARARLDAHSRTTVDETVDMSRRWLEDAAGRTWVIVGNRSAIDEQLAEIGLHPVWITPEDATFGDVPSTASSPQVQP